MPDGKGKIIGSTITDCAMHTNLLCAAQHLWFPMIYGTWTAFIAGDTYSTHCMTALDGVQNTHSMTEVCKEDGKQPVPLKAHSAL